MKKPTHRGIITCAHRGPYKVYLRETKLYWVTENGQKFRKNDGCVTGDSNWDTRRLTLDSIKSIESLLAEEKKKLNHIPLSDSDSFIKQCQTISSLKGKL